MFHGARRHGAAPFPIDRGGDESLYRHRGTKVAVALAPAGTDRAALVARRSEPTVKEGPPDALARQCLRMVDEACAEAGISRAQLQSTGVASCGPFILQDGMVEVSTPNICGGLPGADRSLLPNDWTSIPLQAPLAEALGRVNVQNDAVAALVAERRWGALQGAGPLCLRHLEHRRRRGPVRGRQRAARQERQRGARGPQLFQRRPARGRLRLRQRG